MERFDIDNEGNIIISRDGLYMDADEARAEIERLEKEVAEYDRTIGLFLGALPIKDIIPAAGSIKDLISAISRLSDDRKRAERERDTAWNDAIEAAYAASEQYPPDDMTSADRDAFIAGCMSARNAIRALKRPTQNAPSVEFKSTRTDEAKAADRRAAEEGSKG